MTGQDGELAKVAQAAAPLHAVAAGDYTRDIRSTLRQKTLPTALMQSSRHLFHPATPPARSRRPQASLARRSGLARRGQMAAPTALGSSRPNGDMP